MPTIDLYWSMRSPFCYLALDRLLELDAAPGVRVTVKHVWPGAVRRQGYFKSLNENYSAYHRRDTVRLAEYLGLPYARPKPDPLSFNKETMEPLSIADQPHIGRLTRMGVLALEQGKGLAYLDQVMRLIWDGRQEDWHLGDHLAAAVGRAGLDFASLIARVSDDADRLDSIIDAGGRDLQAAGHWGVPCMIFEGEPFFGQDRLELLQWRIEAARNA